MWILIVLGLFVGSGPFSHQSRGGMSGFSVRDLTETACKQAKDKILSEAKEKGAENFVIVICQKDK